MTQEEYYEVRMDKAREDYELFESGYDYETMAYEAEQYLEQVYCDWYDNYDCENDALYDLICDMESYIDDIRHGNRDLDDFKKMFDLD